MRVVEKLALSIFESSLALAFGAFCILTMLSILEEYTGSKSENLKFFHAAILCAGIYIAFLMFPVFLFARVWN